jgi:hypothetical protein
MATRTIVNTSNPELRQKRNVVVVAASKSFDTNELGVDVEVATDELVMTLPKITADVLGRDILFRNTADDGDAILDIAPATDDKIIGTIAAVSSGGVASKKWRNTKATANKGDFCVLRATKLTEWSIVGGVGVWASEA